MRVHSQHIILQHNDNYTLNGNHNKTFLHYLKRFCIHHVFQFQNILFELCLEVLKSLTLNEWQRSKIFFIQYMLYICTLILRTNMTYSIILISINKNYHEPICLHE